MCYNMNNMDSPSVPSQEEQDGNMESNNDNKLSHHTEDDDHDDHDDQEAETSMSTSDASPDRSKSLTYHDHANVKESEIGNLVRDKTSGNDKNKIDLDSALQDDHASTAGDDFADSASKVITAKSKSTKRKSTSGPRGGVYEPFPLKLHRMLATVEEAGLVGAVSWKSHGRAFQVNHVNQFVQNILPKFFRQTKLTSFQRQLNLYGFRRIIHGTDSGAYFHELFLRGKPFLCQAMVRTKVKGKSRLRASDLAGTELDFYKMPSLPLLTEDDYKKSKNVFFTQQRGENESPSADLESNVASKRRRGSGHRGFDPFDPFSDETEQSTMNDPHQSWTGSSIQRPYADQSSNMNYLDASQVSSSYYAPPNVPPSWWRSSVPDQAYRHSGTNDTSLSTSMNSSMPSSRSSSMAQHLGSMNVPSMSERLPTAGGQMMSANQSSHNSMYNMLPFTPSQHLSQNPASSGSATNPYYYAVDPSYAQHTQQQNSYQNQNPYWNYNQYQRNQLDFYSSQGERNQYNEQGRYNDQNLFSSRGMPSSSQHPLDQSQNRERDDSAAASYPTQVTSSSSPNNATLMHSTSSRNEESVSESMAATMRPVMPQAPTSDGLMGNMSPMKIRGSASGGPNDTIELEVDGDMKELLTAFMTKKKDG